MFAAIVSSGVQEFVHHPSREHQNLAKSQHLWNYTKRENSYRYSNTENIYAFILFLHYIFSRLYIFIFIIRIISVLLARLNAH
jgi:hypothetical protein